MSGLQPTAIDANGIQVITADGNGSVSIGPTGVVLKEGLITPPLITGEIGYAGFSTTNPNGIQFISSINLNSNDLIDVYEISAAGDLFLNPVGSIDCNGKTLNMTAGEIHNCPLVHSQNNNNITIEGKGTGDLILKTGNTNRLQISDTGDWTINGGVGSSGQVLTSGGVGVSPSWTTLASGSVILPSWTTGTRPSPPTNYQMGWNTTSSLPEIYTGVTWRSFTLSSQVSLIVSGFTLGVDYQVVYLSSSNVVIGSPVVGGYTYYRFYPTTTTTGSFISNVNIPGVLEYLVVGGGGGGGGSQNSYSDGGGGGAGGYLSGIDSVTDSVSYAISVGGGGAGGISGAVGVNGSNSSLVVSSGTKTAIGGGAGAGSPSYTLGNSGGSGGGGCGGNNPASTGGTATAGQGSNGGAGFNSSPYYGGGGGGAGAAGSSSNGNGGVGLSNSITGTAIFYAGGGGGGTSFGTPVSGGNGGNGGGGQGGYGGSPNTTGVAGTNGLGGGGGGGGNPSGTNYNGGAGGSGVVIIRFPSFV